MKRGAAYRKTEQSREYQRKWSRRKYAEDPSRRARVLAYYKTPKGRATQARYWLTDGYKVSQRRAYATGTKKAAIKKYMQTAKGRESSLRGTHKRRALDKSVGAMVTAAAWSEIKARHGFACFYCGRSDFPLTRDHRLPLSRGGTHSLENIVPACKPCNSRKWARLPEEMAR